MQRTRKPQILRLREVVEMTGLSRTTIWRRVRARDFPPPLTLGAPPARAAGWLRTEVEDWLRGRSRAAG